MYRILKVSFLKSTLYPPASWMICSDPKADAKQVKWKWKGRLRLIISIFIPLTKKFPEILYIIYYSNVCMGHNCTAKHWIVRKNKCVARKGVQFADSKIILKSNDIEN